ncbi:hypothetical protein [Helicobacter sp. 13S00477-4]|uniref:hypothetical protein n=1 Tax=Helicobacter sp. 13S00477-4 TaxID=1905759 RepID=UPI0015DA41F1|nr:hypothetical protein [Helicobacter sp. 13S00477-4]
MFSKILFIFTLFIFLSGNILFADEGDLGVGDYKQNQGWHFNLSAEGSFVFPTT